jgi:hypothetical protein
VNRRAVILDAGGHVDRLSLDVLRDLHQLVMRSGLTGPRRERGAHGDVHRRRAGDPGADRRLGSRPQLQRLRLEVVEQPSEETQVVILLELAPVRRLDRVSGVIRDDPNPAVGARRDHTGGAQTDRGIQRLRIVVEEVQRPDIERPPGEVDPRRGR